MKKCFIIAVFVFAPTAQAAEPYSGFTCETIVRGISGTVRKALELRHNGHTYQTGAQSLPRFDLVFTPTYKLKAEQAQPEVIVADLVISKVHNQIPVILSATTANFNEPGSVFRELNTKLIRETGLGSSGPYIDERLIIAVKTRGENGTAFNESFWSSSCKANQ